MTQRAWRCVIAVIVVVFVAGRAVVWFREPVVLSPDTPSYRGGAGLMGGEVLSFSGHSPRLWGTPLFYAAFSDDNARAFGQWTVGTLAWILLAVVLSGQLRFGISRVVTAVAVLGLALLPQVVSWDFAIIAESLSISFGVATLALLIWFLGGGGRPALITLTATAFWWTFVRPELRVMVGFVILVLLAHAVVRRTRRWAVVGATAVLVIAVGWVTAITPAMNRTYAARAWNGLSLTESTFAYRLRFQVMPHPKVLAVYQNDLGMPGCPAAQRITELHAWAMTAFIKAYLTCPDLVAWGHRNAGSSGYRFAEADPGLFAGQTIGVLPDSLSAKVSQGSVVLPGFVEQAAFPSRRFVLPGLATAWLLALVAAGVLGAFRRRKLLAYTSVGLTLASVTSLTAELMYAAGDYPRFGIQEALLSRIAIMLMVIAAVDALIGRLRGEGADDGHRRRGPLRRSFDAPG